MLNVKRIHHVAIAARDCDASANALASLFGLVRDERERVLSQRTDVIFLAPSAAGRGLGTEGCTTVDAAVEIISPVPPSPTSPESNGGLERFLDRRGPGLHHICFEVDDLSASLASLKAAGVRLIDETPRMGARGHLVAFLHPASTGGVLFELCASPPGAQQE